jgi:hypothetical protein
VQDGSFPLLETIKLLKFGSNLTVDEGLYALSSVYDFAKLPHGCIALAFAYELTYDEMAPLLKVNGWVGG